MTEIVSSNYKHASILIRISALLGLVNYTLDCITNQKGTFGEFITVFLILAFLILISTFVRKGYQWVKWLLLVLTLTGIGFDAMTGFQVEVIAFKSSIISGIICVSQNILQLIAVILVFVSPKRAMIGSEGNLEPINSLDI